MTTPAQQLRSAEVTLATIREMTERAVLPGTAGNDHARGYMSAMRDVLAVLDARWLPEDAPVILGGQP